jgi:pilus assembly protein CpaE
VPDTRILLLGDQSGDLAGVLTRPGITLTHADDATDAVRLAHDHELIVLDVAEGFRASAEICREIRADPNLTAIPVLCVSASDDVEERILLLEAGADDVIARPFDDRELEARIDALHLRFQRSKEMAPTLTPVETTRRSGRRMVAVYSPKGGVGTTTIAVNLAVTLAMRAPEAVAIVDLATPVGHVATHLNITPRQTLVDLTRDPTVLREPDLLRGASERHSSGLHVLAAPGTPATGPVVPAALLDGLLDTAVRAFPTLVVDAGSALDEGVLALLAHADEVVLVLTPEFPAIKAVHGLLEYLDVTGATVADPTFVLNEHWPREILRLSDIEEALGTRISVRIPFDPFFYLRAANEGNPVVLIAPRSAPAERFAQLASVLLGEASPHAVAPTRPRGLGALFRR